MSYFKKIFSFFLLVRKMINNSQRRQQFALQIGIRILTKIIRRFNYNGEILVNKYENFTGESGVFLLNEATNRYLKCTLEHVNEGVDIAGVIDKFNIEPMCILDIGANVGEISLYLSKRYPNAKVFSLEPSTRNTKYLRRNIEAQYFDTGNITILETAVGDYDGVVDITSGNQAENTIMLSPDQNRQLNKGNLNTSNLESVSIKKLETICSDNEISKIEFVKIDIEGAEPLLTESLLGLKPILIFTEISDKNTEQEYTGMLLKLHDLYEIYDRNLNKVSNVSKFVSDLFSVKDQYGVSATDLWLKIR